MKLGRIAVESPDGSLARLVAVLPERGQVIDLATAERLRLQRKGASEEAARRRALALFPASMTAAIAAGPELLEWAATALSGADEASIRAIEACRWLPAADPPVMRDCMAFERHVLNTFGKAGPVPPVYYEMPVYYKGSQAGLLGHEEVVPWPAYTRWMDYELELGFVVGRAGRNLTPEAAPAHIFGVTIYADYSARDIQGRETKMRLGPTKAKDFGTGVGPWITTIDEIDLANLEMVARINGEEWSRGSSGTIMWSPAELLAYISYGETLQPGDLIGSGTVGFGCGLELGRRLGPGSVVELEVAGIGVLRNVIGQPETEGWEPTPRQRNETDKRDNA